MEENFNYYLITDENEDPDTPYLVDADGCEKDLDIFFKRAKVSNEHIVHLTFSVHDQHLKKPNMDVDCLVTRSSANLLFSKRFKEILEKHNINFLQLVPAHIKTKHFESKDEFFVANVYQELAMFDVEKSEYDKDPESSYWDDIEKIVLDKEKLAKIPLEDRLVFKAEEDCSFVLYHESIVDIIKAEMPRNMQIDNVEEMYF